MTVSKGLWSWLSEGPMVRFSKFRSFLAQQVWGLCSSISVIWPLSSSQTLQEAQAPSEVGCLRWVLGICLPVAAPALSKSPTPRLQAHYLHNFLLSTCNSSHSSLAQYVPPTGLVFHLLPTWPLCRTLHSSGHAPEASRTWSS